MSEVVQPPAFMARGLCGQVDPEVFFPEPGQSSLYAKRVCAVCPVRRQCLSWAVETGQQWGIWGGMSAREMRALRKERRAA